MKKRMAVLTAVLGAVSGGVLVKKVWLEKYCRQKAELEAAGRERDLFYTWLLLEQNGVELEEYFSAHGYKTAAILGMNREGRRLFAGLKDSEMVSVVFGVEADNYAAVHETLDIYRLGDDPLPQADCVVICDLERVSEKAAAVQTCGEPVALAQVMAWLLERHGIKPWDGAIKGWPPEERNEPDKR